MSSIPPSSRLRWRRLRCEPCQPRGWEERSLSRPNRTSPPKMIPQIILFNNPCLSMRRLRARLQSGVPNRPGAPHAPLLCGNKFSLHHTEPTRQAALTDEVSRIVRNAEASYTVSGDYGVFCLVSSACSQQSRRHVLSRLPTRSLGRIRYRQMMAFMSMPVSTAVGPALQLMSA